MIIDFKNHSELKQELPTGVQFLVRIPDLIRALKAAGIVGANEFVTHARLDTNGLTVRVENAKRNNT